MEAKLLVADRFIDMNTEISYRYVYSDTEYFVNHYHFNGTIRMPK